jgi:hypothetical protein
MPTHLIPLSPDFGEPSRTVIRGEGRVRGFFQRLPYHYLLDEIPRDTNT